MGLFDYFKGKTNQTNERSIAHNTSQLIFISNFKKIGNFVHAAEGAELILTDKKENGSAQPIIKLDLSGNVLCSEKQQDDYIKKSLLKEIEIHNAKCTESERIDSLRINAIPKRDTTYYQYRNGAWYLVVEELKCNYFAEYGPYSYEDIVNAICHTLHMNGDGIWNVKGLRRPFPSNDATYAFNNLAQITMLKLKKENGIVRLMFRISWQGVQEISGQKLPPWEVEGMRILPISFFDHLTKSQFAAYLNEELKPDLPVIIK